MFNERSETISLKEKTINKLNRIFSTDEYVWKILIYDYTGEHILAPLYKIGDLRTLGVSLTMHIDAKRLPIKDTTALYFFQANHSNIDILLKDIEKEYYGSYYIEFVSRMKPELLSYFSSKLLSLPKKIIDKIGGLMRRVCDTYISHVVLRASLFDLNINKIFSNFYLRITTDEEIHNSITKIVDGILSVCICLNVKPIVCIPNSVSSPANVIGNTLMSSFNDFIKELTKNNSNSDYFKNFLSSNDGNIEEARVIIIDRTVDITPLLSHQWLYEPLIHDLLSKTDNLVSFDGKKYDMSDDNDNFYNTNYCLPIHEVASNCSTLLSDFKEKMKHLNQNSLNSKKTSNNYSTDDKLDITIQNTLNNVPQMIKEKGQVDKNSDICSKIMKIIDERSIDQYSLLEESFLNANTNNIGLKHNLVRKIRNIAKMGSDLDYMRLMLCFQSIFNATQTDVINSLYLERFKDVPEQILIFQNLMKSTDPIMNIESGQFSNNVQINDTFNENSTSINLLGSVVEKSKDLLMQGVKQIIRNRLSNRLISMIDLILNNREAEVDYFTSLTKNENLSKKLIVFVVGGGSFNEAIEFEKWCQSNNIVGFYGSTDFPRPEEFLTHEKL